MGKTEQGASGSATGKVGPLVYYKWKGVDCVRTRPRVNKKRKLSDVEVKNRSKFRVAQHFLSHINPYIRQGFHNYKEKQTAFNAAMSYTLNNAIGTNENGFFIDYTLVCISKGIPSPLKEVKFTYEEGVLTCQWDYDEPVVRDLNPGFLRTLIAVIPENQNHNPAGDLLNKALTDKMEQIPITPSKHRNLVYHIYLGFVATDYSNRSVDSTYVGRVII